MHIKKKEKNHPINRTIRCCRDLIYRSSANERDTRAIYEIVLSMRIHFDCKILENYFRRSFFSLMVTVQSVVFILISVSICEKSLSRGNFTLKCICTVELHIYSRSNFLYEKILRTTCEERLKRKSDRKRQVPFPIALHFFFSVIFSFISSLPLSFFLSYSMLCLFEHQA